MKKIILCPALLWGCAILASAQVTTTSSMGSNTIKTVDLDAYQVQIIDGVATMQYSNSAANINGSPYLNSNFTPGIMTTLDGTVVPGLSYRYDIYGDRMQFVYKKDTATISKPLSVKSILLEGDQKFIYQVYMVDANRVATGYFEVLEENEHMSILLRRTITLDQDVYTSNYAGGGGSKDFFFKNESEYYMRLKDSAAMKITNKKTLLSAVEEYEDEIKQYMKQQKLKVRKAEDLQAIANYYHDLNSNGS